MIVTSNLSRFLASIKADFRVPEVHRVEAVRLLEKFKPPTCIVCQQRVHEYYMVRNSVWGEAGFIDGQAHLRCLQERLGRPLTLDDFTPAPVNNAIRFGYLMAALV